MHENSFEEALDFIREKDSRYQREAYLFLREALDHTQEMIAKDSHGRSRHVSGQELLAGIRELALRKFGPMTKMLFAEWGVHSCSDFGEIVFNMVEIGGCPVFAVDDIKDLNAFVERLKAHAEPVSAFLWNALAPATRQQILGAGPPDLIKALLVQELNGVLTRGSIYQQNRFAGVALSELTRCLLGRELKGSHIARFNRLLLEDAFPLELMKSHGVLAKTDQDSRADFQDGYDFYEAFQKPFLPPSKQVKKHIATPAPSTF